jgi:DNA-binding NarL/FixJ family response regulator
MSVEGASAVEQGSVRVLIVDDLPQVRQGLATMLRLASRYTPAKIEVIGDACDGREALAQVQSLQPDVVLMDLEMPVMNGYLATQQIKAQYPGVSVVILSIHADPASRQRAVQSGADAFIEKSAPPNGLVGALQGFIRSRNDKELS